MRAVTFKLSERLLEELDLQASKEGRTRSEILRDAVTAYLRSGRRTRKFRVKRIILS